MEVHGGNGYVDEGPLGMLYKEIPLNSIWEGSGNVMCLDVLRALQKHPDSIEAYFAELIPARGNDRSEEHTSELQSLMRISYAVFCLKKKTRSPRSPENTPNLTLLLSD